MSGTSRTVLASTVALIVEEEVWTEGGASENLVEQRIQF